MYGRAYKLKENEIRLALAKTLETKFFKGSGPNSPHHASSHGFRGSALVLSPSIRGHFLVLGAEAENSLNKICRPNLISMHFDGFKSRMESRDAKENREVRVENRESRVET